MLGPTAEEQQDRETATVDETKMRELIEQGSRLLPTLANYSVTASYAGLRPATEQKHYRIQPYPDRQWICVAGIRSTGLTAALGIAQYVEQLYRDHFTPCFTPTAPQTVHWRRCRCSPTTRCAITRARTTAALFAIANW